MGKITKNRTTWVAAFLIALAGFIAYKYWPQGTPPPESPKLVDAEVVQKSQVRKTATLVGTIKPIRQTTFISHDKGVLQTPYIKEGDTVEKGTILVELDNDELIREVAHARENVELFASNYARQKKLVKMKNKSKQSLEKSKEELLKAKMEFEKAIAKLKKTQFTAPYTGTCGVFIAREGQDLKEGDKVVTFYDTSKLSLDIGVPESILTKVNPASEFICLGTSGNLESVQKIIDPESRMGLAHAEIDGKAEACLGSLVDVTVVVAQKEDCLSLPKSAVFMKGKAPFVYRIKEGKADLVPVELGLEGDERIEIAKGIDVGDEIVLRGQEGIWPTRALKAIDKTSKKKA